MTEIPIFTLQNHPLPRYIKSKKFFIKLCTFAVFPKSLRKKLKGQLAYRLRIGAKPFSEKYKKQHQQVMAAFIDKCTSIDRTKYQIISLGSDCMSRTLPTFWGLKPRKKDGEKSFPFDLSGNNITGLKQNLKTDFADFFDGLVWSKDFNHYINIKKGCYYLHEEDLSDTPESVALFHQRFSERIDNFRAALKADKPIIFVFHYGEQLCCSTPDEVDGLYELVKELRGDKPMSFFIIDTTRTLKNVHKDALLYQPDFLPQDYVWHTDASRYTSEGIRFEHEMMEKLLTLVQQTQ